MVSKINDGQYRFRVFLPHATTVELVGGFTRWKAGRILMDKQEPGWWEIVVDVPAGDHEFCYLVDNCLWLADYAAHGVKLSGYAGWVSKLTVRAEQDQAAA